MKNNEISQDGLVEMEEVLRRAEVGRFGLFDGQTPYVLPLNFAYFPGKIGFHCNWKGRKIDILSNHPRCCFEVDEYMGEVGYHYDTLCHLDYDSVLAFGKARIENQVKEKYAFFQQLHVKYKKIYRKPVDEGGKVFDKARLPEACLVIIDVEELSGRKERTIEGKTQKTMWHHKF